MIIFVLGMHRSGSSLTAALLEKLGVSFGHRLLPREPDNPEGFWEQTDLVGFNDQIFLHLGHTWDNPEPLPENWLEELSQGDWLERAARLLQRNFPDLSIPIGLKDPRLCRLLPFWVKVCELLKVQKRVVCVIRDPQSSARSMHRRSGVSEEEALLLWMRYNWDMSSYLCADETPLFHFDQFFSSEQEITHALSSYLGLSSTSESVSEKIVRADLRNFTPSFENANPFEKMADFLYQELPKKRASIKENILVGAALDAATDLAKRQRALAYRESRYVEMDRRALPLPTIEARIPGTTAGEVQGLSACTYGEEWIDSNFEFPLYPYAEGGQGHLHFGPHTVLVTIHSLKIHLLNEKGKVLKSHGVALNEISPNPATIPLPNGYLLFCGVDSLVSFPLAPPPYPGARARLEVRYWLSTDIKIIREHLSALASNQE